MCRKYLLGASESQAYKEMHNIWNASHTRQLDFVLILEWQIIVGVTLTFCYRSFLCFSTFTSPFCYAIVIYVNLVTELATSEINLTWISRKEYVLEHGQPSPKVWNMRTRAWWTYFYICLSSMVYIIYLSLETNNCIIYQSLRLAVSRCQQKPRKWICVMT